VVFSDETSVRLGGVRGRQRVWRLLEEAFHKHCVTHWWKNKGEFMWWSCFSWYEKGPWHIWEPKSSAKKAASKKDLSMQNAARETSNKAKWDAIQVVH
jgi:hypothetical protein